MVDAVGSTPQDTGSKMLVTAAGLHSGTVGGGKVEFKAIQHAQAMLSQAGGDAVPHQLVEWNLQRDVGMTCGGVVKLFFEAYNHCRLAGRDLRRRACGECGRAMPVAARLSRTTCLDSRAGVARQDCRIGERLTKICTDDLPGASGQTLGRRLCALHDDGTRHRSARARRDLSAGPDSFRILA